MLRRNLSALLIVVFLNFNLSPAYTQEAIELTDCELDEIHAGGFSDGFLGSISNAINVPKAPTIPISITSPNGAPSVKTSFVTIVPKAATNGPVAPNTPSTPNLSASPNTPVTPDNPLIPNVENVLNVPNSPLSLVDPTIPGLPNDPELSNVSLNPIITNVANTPILPASSNTPDISSALNSPDISDNNVSPIDIEQIEPSPELFKTYDFSGTTSPSIIGGSESPNVNAIVNISPVSQAEPAGDVLSIAQVSPVANVSPVTQVDPVSNVSPVTQVDPVVSEPSPIILDATVTDLSTVDYAQLSGDVSQSDAMRALTQGQNSVRVSDTSQQYANNIVSVNAAGSIVPVQVNFTLIMNSTVGTVTNTNTIHFDSF